MTHPTTPAMKDATIKDLFDYLAQHGGEIVSTASLDSHWINQARASGRMYVDENGLGFVWQPEGKMPTTEEEVENFEKWFPIEAPLPESLKDPSFLWEKKPVTAKGVPDEISDEAIALALDEMPPWEFDKLTNLEVAKWMRTRMLALVAEKDKEIDKRDNVIHELSEQNIGLSYKNDILQSERDKAEREMVEFCNWLKFTCSIDVFNERECIDRGLSTAENLCWRYVTVDNEKYTTTELLALFRNRK